ncbi:Splicing factor 3B subunit 2 [Desmophyllum pertusum]|uniref:Splicing factor 3B subunit 2 n=1 Tax=Desmophyllum pertusum TaxID=174260 RepID=A0A9X0CV04_9CNID|nr:Splicing factor 3B subunit 2 [Desmophyllum pertusum]
MEEERPSLDELKKLKVVELKARLSSLGLQTSGLKADLIARLDSYFESVRHQAFNPVQAQESGHHEEHEVENGIENNVDTLESDVTEVSLPECEVDNETENDINTMKGDVTDVSLPECEVDRNNSETENYFDFHVTGGNVNEVSVPECEVETRTDSETQIEVVTMEGVVTEVLVSQSEDENGNGIETENEVDTMQDNVTELTVPECEVENGNNCKTENEDASTESDVTVVSVEANVLESIATVVEQNKLMNTVSATKKRRRRRAGETSGRQRGLKRLRIEKQDGIDAQECEVIFGEKNWPPPFEDTVIAMRSSLMQFTKKTQGWTKDDMAELRIYYRHKWKVAKGYEAMLNHHFKVASLSPRCFIAARQMMDNHKRRFANGKSLLRREVRPGLFDCLRTLCPIDNEEAVYEQLKSYAEGRRKQGIRTAPPLASTRNVNTKPDDKFKAKYENLKLEYDKLKKDKEKLARINAQLVKTISSLTELLQDRSLVSDTTSYEEPHDEELIQESPSLPENNADITEQ